MLPLSSLKTNHDGFAFNVTMGESYTLNPCARLILEYLNSGKTQAQIAQTIAQDFGITLNTVERDIADFCLYLKSLGFAGANV